MRITELFAFAAVGPFGEEVILCRPAEKNSTPMMAPTRQMLEVYRQEAEGRLAAIGARLLVARFVRVEE